MTGVGKPSGTTDPNLVTRGSSRQARAVLIPSDDSFGSSHAPRNNRAGRSKNR